MTFEDWKLEHGKVYTQEEELTRKAIWDKNMEDIRKHNKEAAAGTHSYTFIYIETESQDGYVI